MDFKPPILRGLDSLQRLYIKDSSDWERIEGLKAMVNREQSETKLAHYYRIFKEEMDKEFAHMSTPDGQTDTAPKHT